MRSIIEGKVRPIQHFRRENIFPPEQHGNYTIIPFGQSDRIIEDASLDEVPAQILQGLLRYGGVMQFPGGTGLDYQAPYKELYIPKYTRLARDKVGEAAQELKANCIIAPDISALLWAENISEVSGLPILRVLKDGNQRPNYYQGAVQSYTKGTEDIMYIKLSTLARALEYTNGKLRLLFADEIADTGKMFELIVKMVADMQEDGIDVEVVGAGVLIEKVFTGVRKRMKKEFNIPLISGLRTVDMWCPNPEVNLPAAIVVEGIEGIAFAFQE